MLPLVLTALIVVEDQTVLRAAPEDQAPRTAMLWRGDWLERRGEAHGYLSVYDHRRQRAGYVAAERVRAYPLDVSSVAQLRPVIAFLGESREVESLGIGLAALYLRVAAPEQIDAGLFEALGGFAERLALRASTSASGSAAEHLDVARSYGLVFTAFDVEGRAQVCYDGEAHRHLLSLGGSPEQRARAALALSDRRCLDPALSRSQRIALDDWHLKVLEQIDPLQLEPRLANAMRIQRAVVSADVAYARARGGDVAGAQRAFDGALDALTRVDKSELWGAHKTRFEEATVRVAAARWAGEPLIERKSPMLIRNGAPGETCLNAGTFERCSYAQVWAASAQISPKGDQMVLSVEPVPGWLELWILTQDGDSWRVDTLVPALVAPGLGYVELAGWSSDGSRILIAREAKTERGLWREFQVLDAKTLEIEKSAKTSAALVAFRRFSSTDWRRSTLALR